MKNVHLLAAVFLLVLWQGASAQDTAGPTIRLRIFHNGRVISGPDHIEMAYCGREVDVPIRDQKFSIPVDALTCPQFGLEVNVGKVALKPAGIPASRLREGLWDIFFAESKFGHGYDSYIHDFPTRQNIRSMCVVSFEPNGEEGTFILDPHCRSSSLSK
jgi:hypothetical protein